MNELTDEQISELEVAVRDRYKGNPDTTQRAYDKKYIQMLEQLKTAYRMRKATMIKDQLGWTTSDARRVQVYEETLVKLEEERQAVAEYLLKDPDR